MDKVVDHLFVFEGDGVVKDFPGNYSNYRFDRTEKEKQIRLIEKKEKQRIEIPIKKPQNKIKKLSYKEQREYEQLTIDIEQLEADYKELETSLNSGKLSNEKAIEASLKLGDLIKLIDIKTNRWLELSEI